MAKANSKIKYISLNRNNSKNKMFKKNNSSLDRIEKEEK